jgi:hypothetical protein
MHAVMPDAYAIMNPIYTNRFEEADASWQED